jgi:hypothetical protein
VFERLWEEIAVVVEALVTRVSRSGATLDLLLSLPDHILHPRLSPNAMGFKRGSRSEWTGRVITLANGISSCGGDTQVSPA